NWNGGGTPVAIRRSVSPWSGVAMPGKTANFDVEKGLIGRTHAAGKQFFISIGGWTGSVPFIKMVASSSARTRFVKDCMSLMRPFAQGGYDLDGIDLDWEYPGDTHSYQNQNGTVTHCGTAQDKQNFMALLKELRDSIDIYLPGKLLTAALPCDSDKVVTGYDVTLLNTYLDELNLMTYDFFGEWNNPPVCDHHTGLFSSGNPGIDTKWNIAAACSLYVKLGVDPSKINIGLAFYGRAVSGGKKPGDRFTGGYSWADGVQGEYAANYFQIAYEMSQGKWSRGWDEKAKSVFAYNNNGYISFDDTLSIQYKCQYVKDAGFNGAIVWDMWGDWMADGSTPLLDKASKEFSTPVNVFVAGRATKQELKIDYNSNSGNILFTVKGLNGKKVAMDIFDLGGKHLASLMQNGNCQFTLSGNRRLSGSYIAVLKDGKKIVSNRVLVLN
ncbi:MAG: hypothetical protein GX640_23540, partial [Fibrobacter sp.]|nr:hypothetical protein [Fibrobacter sp.]